jgi:hypothetical protein
MTAHEFREQTLNLPGAEERSHMGHPDFRTNGKVFATLGYPDEAWGMVKLALPDQKKLIAAHPQVFSPAKGAWGLQGSTMVRLDAAKPDLVTEALHLALQNSAEADAVRKARKRSMAARKKSPTQKTLK